MAFVAFHTRFPEIAAREVRSLRLEPGPTPLAGEYAFVEMFCDEPGCDCRRVYFWVIARDREGPVAVVEWGWESLSFYRNSSSRVTLEDALAMQGPTLHDTGPQTDAALAIVDLTDEVLIKDRAYVERIKRHYQMFRAAVEADAAAAPQQPKRRTPKKRRRS